MSQIRCSHGILIHEFCQECEGDAARPQEPKQGESKIACLDCGCDYGKQPLDVTLSKAQWAMIHPEIGGVLCAGCIVRRAAKLPKVITVAARIAFADDYDKFEGPLSPETFVALAARPQEPTASQTVRELVAKWRWRANNVGFKGACDANQFRAGDIEQCANELEAALSQQASQPPEAQDALAKAHDDGLREGIKVGFIGGERAMAEKAGQLREACEFAIGAIEDAIGLEDGLDGAEGQAVLKMLRNALAAAVEPPQEPKP